MASGKYRLVGRGLYGYRLVAPDGFILDDGMSLVPREVSEYRKLIHLANKQIGGEKHGKKS